MDPDRTKSCLQYLTEAPLTHLLCTVPSWRPNVLSSPKLAWAHYIAQCQFMQEYGLRHPWWPWWNLMNCMHGLCHKKRSLTHDTSSRSCSPNSKDAWQNFGGWCYFHAVGKACHKLVILFGSVMLTITGSILFTLTTQSREEHAVRIRIEGNDYEINGSLAWIDSHSQLPTFPIQCRPRRSPKVGLAGLTPHGDKVWGMQAILNLPVPSLSWSWQSVSFI